MKIETYNKISDTIACHINGLVEVCKEFDKSKGCISLDNTLNVYPNMNYLFLLYENEALVSVLTIFMPMSEEAEVYAYTLPAYRLRGCFSRLLQEARIELGKYGTPRLLYVVESGSESGTKVMSRLNCKLDFTEYLLGYQEADAMSIKQDAMHIKLLRAEHGDAEALVKLSMNIFSETYNDAKSQLLNTLNSANRIQYMAVLGEEPIGLGSVSIYDSEASIYGFGISPNYREKGYGKELLLLIVSEIKRKGDYKITLEVNSTNNAFHLYRKLGFVIEQAFDYYR